MIEKNLIAADYIQEVGHLSRALEKIGLIPVLIGGMALVFIGSQRVTKDFDLVIPNPKDYLDKVMEIFYTRGFELVSKLNENKEVIRTIDNQRVAASRIRLDEPGSVYFFNHKTRLRIDLLFDFPQPAGELADRAKKIRVFGHLFRTASIEDLIAMKKMAYADRALATDAQDLEFLQKKLS